MSTMKLKEKLSDDFNIHGIVVNESYAQVQQNGVLKVEFKFQIDELLKRIKKAKQISQNTNKGKDTDKNNAITPL